MPDPEPSAPMDEEIELDSAQQEHLQQRLRDEQNLVGATVAGASAALAGAAIWAVITLITGYQIGFMAVGVGFLVGYSVRVTGKGVTGVFGVVGAVFALVGCLLGNLLAVTALAAQVDGIPFLDALSLLTPEIIYDLMVAYSSPIDIVFYGIAIYEGYQFSFRRINSDEIQRVLSGAPGQGTPAVRLVASLLGLVIVLVLVLAVWTGGSLQPWEEEFLLGQDALERSDYSAAELHLATSLELIEQFEPLPADGREMKAWVESSLADSDSTPRTVRGSSASIALIFPWRV